MISNSEILVVAIMLPVLLQILFPLAMLFAYGLFSTWRLLFRSLSSGRLMYIPYAGRSYSLVQSKADAEIFKLGNGDKEKWSHILDPAPSIFSCIR
jgi:hypothetical protein